MNLQSVVSDVKGRVETLGVQGQEVAKISLDTLKQANTVVIDSFHSLLEGHSAAAKDIFTSAKSGFEKAKADGFKAVASDPIAYLPPVDKFVDAFNETVSHFTKTGSELVKTVKTGFEYVQSQITGKPVVVKKAKTAAKTAVRSVKKVAASAKKQVKSAGRATA